MSILPSHMDAGLIFCILGLWHLYSTLRSYASNPRAFRSKAWFPSRFPGIFRALELWTLLFVVVIFICKQLSHATADFSSGSIKAEHLMRYQHVVFSLMYLVYICAALIHENSRYLPLPPGALQATFAMGFVSELIVFHFGHHPGDDLESYVHMLMQLVLVFLVLLMFLEVMNPTSILVSVARCMCLILKGTWFFYIGVLINNPSAVPSGCSTPEDADFPSCPLPADDRRAKALQILVLNLQIISTVILALSGYVFVRWIVGETPENADYEEIPAEDDVAVYYLNDENGELAKEIEKSEVPILKDLPRSLSHRFRKNTPRGIEALPASSPLLSTVLMVNSPLPKNIKNV